jgi:hypothetical protein
MLGDNPRGSVRRASGLVQTPFQELIKRPQILQSPVLSCPYLAQIASELDKVRHGADSGPFLCLP